MPGFLSNSPRSEHRQAQKPLTKCLTSMPFVDGCLHAHLRSKTTFQLTQAAGPATFRVNPLAG